MALVTKVVVRLMRKPELVKTILAIYDSAGGLRAHGGRDHRARHHAGRDRNAGRRDAAHGGRSDARRLPHGRGGGAADRTGRPARERWKSRWSRFATPATPAGRANFAWRNRPRSATCCGRAARMHSAPWAASARPITCRTAWCRARRSPPRCGYIAEVAREVRADHQQYFPRRRRQHASHHPVRPAQAGRPGEGAPRGRRDPGVLHRGGRIDHRRARRRHGEERADGRAVLRRHAGDDPQFQSPVRSRIG